MKKQFLLSFFLFLISFIGFGQSKLISGKIVIDAIDDWTELYGIRIVNKQTNEEVLTNEEGIFQLNVNLNDDLIISSGFTDKRKLKVTEGILNKGTLEIHLDLEVIQLAETTVNTLKSNLKDNIKIVDSDKTKLYKQLGLNPDMQYAKLNPHSTSALNNKNFVDPTMWMTRLSGKHKNDQKNNEYFKQVELLKDLKEYFTVNYFVNNLHIPEYKVDEFINYCYSKAYFKNLVQNYKYEEITYRFEREVTQYIKLITP